MATQTTNINLTEPAYNSTSPTWDQPLNNNFSILDYVLGSTTSVTVSSSSSPTYTLISAPTATPTANTSQCFRILLTGSLNANQLVLLPQGISGSWVVSNATTGSYNVSIGSNSGSNSAAGTVVVVPQGFSIFLYASGGNVNKSDDGILGDSSATVNFGTVNCTTLNAATGNFSGNIYGVNEVLSGSLSVPSASISNLSVSSETISGSLQVDSLGVGTPASGVTGEIRATNNITGYYSSDERLKNNVSKITDALKKVNTINGVEFDWSDEFIAEAGGEDGYFIRKHDVGVIAQEIESVLPEVVATREDGYKAVKYDRIVALLIEAVKELSDKVDRLEGRS